MKCIITLLIAFTQTSLLMAQSQSTFVEINPNGTVQIQNNLSSGQTLDNLTWASNSSMACWPATQNAKFNGKHQFHHFNLPPHAEVEITLVPDDPNQNMSLYGYQVPSTSSPVLPPAIHACTSCEADHKWDYPKRGKTQDHTRHIFFNSIENSYTVVVGVTGPEGLEEGGYSLNLTMKSKVPNTIEQAPLTVYTAEAVKGKTMAYEGNLADGTPLLDLSWAANSSMACWPSTQNAKFNGNHVYFLVQLPAQSEMDIRLVPSDAKANMSLFAIQDAANNTALPPDILRCTTCEADHKWDYPKRGQTQDHTRSVHLNSTTSDYRVVVGVSGAEGLKEGSFILEITLR